MLEENYVLSQYGIPEVTFNKWINNLKTWIKMTLLPQIINDCEGHISELHNLIQKNFHLLKFDPKEFQANFNKFNFPIYLNYLKNEARLYYSLDKSNSKEKNVEAKKLLFQKIMNLVDHLTFLMKLCSISNHPEVSSNYFLSRLIFIINYFESFEIKSNANNTMQNALPSDNEVILNRLLLIYLLIFSQSKIMKNSHKTIQSKILIQLLKV